ncbi:MAG: response regulator [Candidatus Omnitrophica bacterium]|nr:response regulator [Candidatus Omnitrophota bacterium]
MVKLLVADDERKICRLLELFFSERGYSVLLAHDGPTTLACIRDERPHLVFLDLHMPGVDGLDILREAREVDETIKIIVITGVEDAQMIQRVKALGAADYVIKPFSLEYLQEEVLAKVSNSLYEDLRAANQELKRSLEEMRQVTRGIVAAFSLVISKIDPHYTHEHVSRSVEYAGKILAKLREMGVALGGMSDELLLAGILLHDVGKIFTPKEILFKPGPLSNEEWRIMRRHPVDGAEILEQITGLKEMAKIVRYHQEAYDGSGYPEGLKGEQIPIGARIATVVDAFDAMVTDRPYRKGMPIEGAIGELRRNRGVQFDPIVVDAIIGLYEEGTLKPAHLPEPAARRGSCRAATPPAVLGLVGLRAGGGVPGSASPAARQRFR